MDQDTYSAFQYNLKAYSSLRAQTALRGVVAPCYYTECVVKQGATTPRNKSLRLLYK